MEISKSEGRQVILTKNPVNQNHVITVNDAVIELTTKELTDIANAALVIADNKQPAEKKGK